MADSRSRRSDQDRQEPRQGAQAIRRALTVLRILAAGREEGVPLLEVVQSTGLTRPTAHRILHVLIEEGIVEKSPKSGRYAIGRQVPELALARQSRSPLLTAAEPYLARVSQQVGDTLFLTARTGLDTLCIARRIGTYPIQVLSIEVGARRPLGVSSAGIAILAALPAAEARRIVSDNHMRFQGYRTTVELALEQIAVTRRRGYCLHHTGLVHGTKAISTTIRALDGQPAAAITIAAVRSRLGPRREDEIVEVLKLASAAIEQTLRRDPRTKPADFHGVKTQG
jgi:DNA-binding IclR family transcriptional regulator